MITFQDKLVEFVTCHKHLGNTFDSNGTFHTHIVNIIKSASQRLCALRKLKYVLNRHYLARIYLIFIRPMLEYACELWDGCCQQDCDNLEKLQLEAARILTGLPLFASRESIYSETGWELLSDTRRVRRFSLFYSIHNQSAPEHPCDLMPLRVGSISQYDLRNSNNYVIPNCRLKMTKQSFFPSTTRDWNNLNPEIRNSDNINIFKRKKKILLKKVLFYFGWGDRKLNIFHSRLRNMCSSLNADLHLVNLKPNPACICDNGLRQ
jgi:hypothetical protein